MPEQKTAGVYIAEFIQKSAINVSANLIELPLRFDTGAPNSN